MAKLYTTQGEIKEVKPVNGKTFTLKELQDYVGGYVELTLTHDDKEMYINEDGKINGLPYNQLAPREFCNNANDVIVGDAIVCDYEEIDHGE
jgi:hypothetical protein